MVFLEGLLCYQIIRLPLRQYMMHLIDLLSLTIATVNVATPPKAAHARSSSAVQQPNNELCRHTDAITQR
jgi:hypothetical protein